MTLVPASPKDRITLNADGSLSGRARGVPFAKDAKHIAVLAQGTGGLSIALVEAGACRIEAGLNLANDGNDTVTLANVPPITIKPAPKGFDQTTLMLMGRRGRAACRSRARWNRCSTSACATPTSASRSRRRFQSSRRCSTTSPNLPASRRQHWPPRPRRRTRSPNSTSFDDAMFLEAAAAKIRCSEAAEKGAAIAHQVHGAIGFTIEHILHRYSLRALAWRDDFGSESYWAGRTRQAGRRPRRRRIVAAGGVAVRVSMTELFFTSPLVGEVGLHR